MRRRAAFSYGFLLPAAVVAGYAIGAIAWRPPDVFWALWLLPPVWRLAAHTARRNGFYPLGAPLSMLAYYSSALLPSAAALRAYWPALSVASSVAMALATPILLSLPWFWAAASRDHRGLFRHPAVRYFFALSATAIPPLGALGMASPLFAAAPAFPSTGLLGLAVTLVLMPYLACSTPHLHGRRWPYGASFVFLSLCSAILISRPGVPAAARPFIAVPTRLGPTPRTLTGWFHRNAEVRARALSAVRSSPPGSILVFPEDILGPWTRWSAQYWRPVAQAARARHDILLMGVTLRAPEGGKLDAIIGLGQTSFVGYARQPIPLGSWAPWYRDGYRASWFRLGPYVIGSHRIALLVCYEQLLVWPAAWSFLSSEPPSIILAVSNHGWAPAHLPEIHVQAAAAEAIGRLFAVPVLATDNL